MGRTFPPLAVAVVLLMILLAFLGRTVDHGFCIGLYEFRFLKKGLCRNTHVLQMPF